MSIKKQRKIYTSEIKVALSLAERIGVAAAAKELNIYDLQIHNWKVSK